MFRFHSDPLAPCCFVYVLQAGTTSTAHQIQQSGTIILQASLAVCSVSAFTTYLILDMIDRFIN